MRQKQNKTRSQKNRKQRQRKGYARINTLQKQLENSQHINLNELQRKDKEENTAVLSLLQIKDESHQHDWKSRHHLLQHPTSKININSNNQFHTKDGKYSSNKSIAKYNNKGSILQNQKGQNQVQHEQNHKYNSNNLINKKLRHQQILNLLNCKHSQIKEKQFLEHQYMKLINQSKWTKRVGMNKTSYFNSWEMKDKIKRNLHSTQKEPFDKETGNINSRMEDYNHLEDEEFLFENAKKSNSQLEFSNTNWEFYKNTPNFKNTDVFNNGQNNQTHDKLQKSSKSIKILSNKAFTVRQMLNRLKSNQNIKLVNPELIQNLSNNPTTIFLRQPFDPYLNRQSKQHYKRFTPFKIEQQKRIQYSLSKLQEHLKHNPQFNADWQEIEFKYLQKPNYCSWVQRFKQKIKIKNKNHAPTVKPLKVIND